MTETGKSVGAEDGLLRRWPWQIRLRRWLPALLVISVLVGVDMVGVHAKTGGDWRLWPSPAPPKFTWNEVVYYRVHKYGEQERSTGRSGHLGETAGGGEIIGELSPAGGSLPREVDVWVGQGPDARYLYRRG